MLTVKQSKKILDKWLVVLVLVFSFTSVAFGVNYKTYVNSFTGNCMVYDADGSSKTLPYDISNGSLTSSSEASAFIYKCESKATNCDDTSSALSVDGGTYYFHDTQSNQYITVTFTYGVGFSIIDVYSSTEDSSKSSNTNPVINTTFTNSTINENSEAIKYDVNISDSEGDDLNLTIESNNTSILTVTPNFTNPISKSTWESGLVDFNLSTVENASGVVNITLTLSDGELNATKDFNVTVTSVNHPPVINTNFSNLEINENNTTNYDVNISDSDGDDLNLTIVSNNTSILTVTPNFTNPISKSTWESGLVNFNLSTLKDVSGMVKVTLTLTDGEVNVTKEFDVDVSENVTDNTPDDFNFTPKTKQDLDSEIISNQVTIRGIDNNTSISIVNGEYKIGAGSFTNANGVINNEDNVTVKLISSNSYETKVTATLTIGTLSRDFNVTTKSEEIKNPTEETGKNVTIYITDLEESNINDETIVITNVQTNKSITKVVSGEANGKFNTTITVNSDTSGEVNSISYTTETLATVEKITEGYKVSSQITKNSITIPVTTMIYNNGTSQTQLNFGNKTFNIVSLLPDVIQSIQNEMLVVEKLLSDNVTLKGFINDNQSTVSYNTTTVGDNETNATCDMNNTTIVVLEDNAIQMSASNSLSDKTLKIVVKIKPNGEVVNLSKLSDNAGNSFVSGVSSKVVGSHTTVNENGSMTTTLVALNELYKNVLIEIASDQNTANQHKVTTDNLTTVAQSYIKGASSTIYSDKVQTTVKPIVFKLANQTIKATLDTSLNGESLTKFSVTSLDTNTTKEYKTVVDTTPFENGNKIEVLEENNSIKIKIQTKVTKELRF